MEPSERRIWRKPGRPRAYLADVRPPISARTLIPDNSMMLPPTNEPNPKTQSKNTRSRSRNRSLSTRFRRYPRAEHEILEALLVSDGPLIRKKPSTPSSPERMDSRISSSMVLLIYRRRPIRANVREIIPKQRRKGVGARRITRLSRGRMHSPALLLDEYMKYKSV